MTQPSGVRLPGIAARTAIVLGAGGAIGELTAHTLAAMGANVAVVTRDTGRSNVIAKALPGSAASFTADLAVPASLSDMVGQVSRTYGDPSILINCAAIGAPRSSIDEVSHEEISTICDVNIVGAFDAVRAALPALRSAGGGTIVNVASIAAYRVAPGSSAYGASKAALISLTQHLAVELGPEGIRVNSISPGQTPTRLRAWDEAGGTPPVSTGITDAGAIPLRRRGELSDYVGAIMFLCSGMSEYITGVDIPVEGGARLTRSKSY